jgi:hypothetical protein
MFGSSFQPSESLKAMVYFSGSDLHTLSNEDKILIATTAAAVHRIPLVQSLAPDLSITGPYRAPYLDALRTECDAQYGKGSHIER